MNKSSLLLAALIALVLTAFDAKADYKELWSLGAIDVDFQGKKPCGKDAFVVMSWNVANFGGNESAERIEAVASVLRYAEIAAVLEVSGSYQGPKAVSLLQDELSRKGAKWRVAISNATTPEPAGKNTSERVAFLWKNHAVSVGAENSALVSGLAGTIAREPYRIEAVGNKIGKMELYGFHARPEGSGAKEEAALLADFLKSSPVKTDVATVVMGDFNLGKPQLDKAFVPAGFQAGVSGASSLKKDGSGVSKKRDNAYFRNASVCEAGRIRTDKLFGTKSVMASDHVPVYVVFQPE